MCHLLAQFAINHPNIAFSVLRKISRMSQQDKLAFWSEIEATDRACITKFYDSILVCQLIFINTFPDWEHLDGHKAWTKVTYSRFRTCAPLTLTFLTHAWNEKWLFLAAKNNKNATLSELLSRLSALMKSEGNHKVQVQEKLQIHWQRYWFKFLVQFDKSTRSTT